MQTAYSSIISQHNHLLVIMDVLLNILMQLNSREKMNSKTMRMILSMMLVKKNKCHMEVHLLFYRINRILARSYVSISETVIQSISVESLELKIQARRICPSRIIMKIPNYSLILLTVHFKIAQFSK